MLYIAEHIAKLHSWDINVKFHPSNNRSRYKETGIGFKEGLDMTQSRCLIGHTSSMLYEALQLGLAAFKYRSDIPCLETPEELTFDDAENLTQKLSMHHDFCGLAKQYILYTGKQSLEAYGEFFRSILNQGEQAARGTAELGSAI